MEQQLDTDQSKGEAGKLEELSELRAELNDRPQNISLHEKQVRILLSLPMADEFSDALDGLASLVTLSPSEYSVRDDMEIGRDYSRSRHLDELPWQATRAPFHLGFVCPGY